MLKKTLCLIILLAFLLNILAPSASASLVADFLWERAVKYYASGNLQEAEQTLKEILLVNPDHQQARRLLLKIASARRKSLPGPEMKPRIPELEPQISKVESQIKEAERKQAAQPQAPPQVRETPPPPSVEKLPPPAQEAIPKAVMPTKWITAKPKELVSSPQLKEYRLFTEGKVFIDEQPIELAPVIIEENDIWLPLQTLSQAFGLVAFPSGKDRLTVIDTEGLPLEFNLDKTEVLVSKKPYLVMPKPLAIYQGYFMLNLESLQKTLGLVCEYLPATEVVKIGGRKALEFKTFALEKPPALVEEQRIEKAQTIAAQPRQPRQIKEELLPREYYPDIDLKLDSTFRYYYDSLDERRTRYMEHYLRGRMYDLDVFGHLSMRDYDTDQKRTFKEDGQHLSFFKQGAGLKLLDNYLRLPDLRSQSQPYWGLELDLQDIPVKNYAWVGQTDPVYTSALEGGRSVKYYGNLYAFKQDWLDTENFSLSATELFTHSHAELSEDGGASNFPRKNFVYLLDSDWKIFPELNFYNTFAQCIYMPDNKHDAVVSDYDFKSGIALQHKRFNLNSSFEYVGDRYASLGLPSTYQDYIGWDINTDTKLTDYLSLNIGASINRDNVAFNENEPSSHNRDLSAATNLLLPWNQNLNFGWDYSRYLTRGGLENASGNEYQSYRIDYYKALEAASLQLGWQHYRMDPLASSSGSMFFDTYSATIYKSFPALRGSYLRLYQDLSHRKELSMGDSPSTTTSNTTLSGRYNLSPRLSLTGDCRVRNVRQDQADDTTTMSLAAGTEYNFSPATTINCTYEASNIDLTRSWFVEDWSILVYVRHLFDLKTPEKWGMILVSVFEDLNGNDSRDAEEQGLEDVLAYVVQGRGAKSDFSGQALIEKVVPGLREVRLDLRDLPVEMVIKGDPTKEVAVESLKTKKVAFAVVTSGAIEGRVFVDIDNNGIFDKDIDIPLPNVRMFLSPEYQDTLSFSDGSYRFDSAYPGPSEVHVDLEWVPKEYRLVSPEAKEIEVKPKQTAADIDFVFQGRPLKIQYF